MNKPSQLVTFVLRKCTFIFFAISFLFFFSYFTYRQYLNGLNRTCSCYRPSFYSVNNRSRLNSTCSDPGTFYESHQNVVSFSLHLPGPGIYEHSREAEFLRGISANLEAMRKHCPGFSMRIYSDENLMPGSNFCKLWCESPDLFWCDVRRSPILGNIATTFYTMWRFAAMGDPTVDTFLSRDLDSLITSREVAAVKEWLNLSKPIHVMRDNPNHCIPFLAGTWGARNGLLGNDSKILQDKLIHTQLGGYMMDQIVLQHAFISRGEDIVAHDSHCCIYDKIPRSTVLPFPTQRLNAENDFVGNPTPGKGNYFLEPCPERCRPTYGKNWTYC